MKKKLLSLFASVLLVSPVVSFAVGLGSVRTYSHLNEKLRAEIPILSVKKKGKMTVALAPNADFAKRGVRREDILNELNFSLMERKGRIYVNVSSRKQIAVPYLNFILRLSTPEGVVSREYAIFLDPVSGRKVTTAAKAQSRQSIVSASPYRKSFTSKRTVTGVSGAKAGRYGPIRKGETLWSIAKHTRPSVDIPVADMMRAIRRANPRTLARGLPAGVMINIPTLQGYATYRGGYAPMPVKVTKAKSHKKTKPKSSRKRHTAKVNKSKLRDKSETAEKKAFANEMVARPNLPEGTSLTSGSKFDDLTEITGDISETVAEKVDDIAEGTENTVGSVVETVSQTTNTVVEGTKDAINGVTEAVGETTSNIVERTQDAIGDVPKNIAETASSLAEGANVVVDDVVNHTAIPEMKDDAVTLVPESETANMPQSGEIPAMATIEEMAMKPQSPSTTIAQTNTSSSTQPTEPPKPFVQPAPPAEASLMDTVIDSAPIVGGVAAVAGLGGLLLLRHRKKKAVISLTDEDKAVLLGEGDIDDDIDSLQSLDDELFVEADADDVFDRDDSDTLAVESGLLLEDELVNDDVGFSDDDLLVDLDDTDHDLDEILMTDVLSADSSDKLSEAVDDDKLLFGFGDDELLNDESGLSGTLETDEHKTVDTNDSLEFDFTTDAEDDLLFTDGENTLPTDSTSPLADVSGTTDDGIVFDFKDDNLFNEEPNLGETVEIDKMDTATVDVNDSLEFDFTMDEKDDILTTDLATTLENVSGTTEDDGLAFDFDDDDLFNSESGLDESITADDMSTVLDTHDALDFDVTESKDELFTDDEMDVVTTHETNDLDFNLDTLEDEKSINDFTTEVDKTSDLGFSMDDVQHVTSETTSRMQMKLDLANSFISISQEERAKTLLQEVMRQGSDEQIAEAKQIMHEMS